MAEKKMGNVGGKEIEKEKYIPPSSEKLKEGRVTATGLCVFGWPARLL